MSVKKTTLLLAALTLWLAATQALALVTGPGLKQGVQPSVSPVGKTADKTHDRHAWWKKHGGDEDEDEDRGDDVSPTDEDDE